jgi:ribosome-associated toxin RatA of RatAB toxin-antitoxin module
VQDVVVRVVARAVDADGAYERIRQFERYPELTDAVEQVNVHPADADGSVLSQWTVHFRSGLLRWEERDRFWPADRTVSFEQTSGDFAIFIGSWRADPHPDGAEVTFAAQFDLGIPTLAPILDPVARSALRSNVLLILHGLLGDVQEQAGEPEVPVGGRA